MTMGSSYHTSLVFRYLDTFPRPPGVPEWPRLIPEPDAATLEERIRAGNRLVGDPDEVARGVQLYADVGCDQLIFGLLASRQPQEVALHTLELFGREVLPRFDRDALHSTTRMRAAALACAREGADVVLAARTAAALEAVAAEVRSLGRRALAVPTDVARPEDCRRLADAAHAELGRIDVLVNNAFRSAPYEPVEEASMEDWRRIFDVNLFGAVQLSQAVIPCMKAQGGGCIVMIGSMSMRVIEPRFGGYAASKAALVSAVQTLAKELGAAGIRVNSVVPGYIWGPALERYFADLARQRGTTPEAVYAEVASRTALGRIPTSEDVAAAVVFFASELARAVTGQALDVNAGHYFH